MSAHEVNGLRRYVPLTAGVIVVGLAAAAAMPFLQSARGVAAPTVSQAESPVLAALALVGVVVVGTVVAIVVGRFVNTVTGLFAMGAGLTLLTMRSGTIEDYAFFRTDSLTPLVIGTIGWTVVVGVVAWATFRGAGPLRDIPTPDDPDEHPTAPLSTLGLLMCLSGLITPIGVWLIAQSPMKGQVWAAVALGAATTALVGRLIGQYIQPVLLYPAAMLGGVIGHVVGAALLDGAVDVALARDTLSHLSYATPLDYAAGVLVGVSAGVGWAKAFLHEVEE